MHLTNDMRNQGIEISFRITSVKDGQGHASVTGYEVLPSQMKRVVRRGRSKVMDSFIVRCGKEQLVRIKPMAFTANRASRGAQTAIRLTLRQRIKQLLGQTTFDQLVQDLIQFKLQRTLKESAGQHHPIKSVEVKACFLLPQKATGSTPDIQETAEDKQEQTTEDVPEERAEPAADGPAEPDEAPAGPAQSPEPASPDPSAGAKEEGKEDKAEKAEDEADKKAESKDEKSEEKPKK